MKTVLFVFTLTALVVAGLFISHQIWEVGQWKNATYTFYGLVFLINVIFTIVGRRFDVMNIPAQSIPFIAGSNFFALAVANQVFLFRYEFEMIMVLMIIAIIAVFIGTPLDKYLLSKQTEDRSDVLDDL